MKKLLNICLLLMLAAGLAQAQGFKGSADVVKVSGAVAEAVAGQRVSFDIKLQIDKTWHLYAHGDTNFIGVDLVPDEGFALQELTVAYPPGHMGEFFGEKVKMIDGHEVLKGSALVPADMARGVYDLAFKVTAQACDDKTCLAPAYLPVSVKLTVK